LPESGGLQPQPPGSYAYVQGFGFAVAFIFCCSVHSYSHDTRSGNRRHKSTIFSGACFWCVCHAKLGPDSSVTRLRRRVEHCSIPSQKVAYTWLKWSFIIYSFQLTFGYNTRYNNSSHLGEFMHRLRHFQPCLFSAPEICISDVYGTKNRHQKMELIYGADFWSVWNGY